MTAELRRDPLSGQEVIIAPGRAGRPHGDLLDDESEKLPEPPAECPLCPGNEHLTPPTTLALPGGGTAQPWSVRVIPNLYPIVSSHGEDDRGHPGRSTTGVHEVVVETPHHHEELADRDPSQVVLLLEAFQIRLRDLEGRPRTRQVQVFKNKGSEAGTSLEHPHSQIVALDFLPELTARRVQRARRYHQREGGCLLCAVVADERARGDRLVLEDEGFVALAPYASLWAGEVQVIPLSHAPSFTAIDTHERELLARHLIALAGRLKATFDDPPYNLVLQTAPARRLEDPALHWYWQLTPRMTRKAGLEVGSGIHVNPLPPEETAALLRA